MNSLSQSNAIGPFPIIKSHFKDVLISKQSAMSCDVFLSMNVRESTEKKKQKTKMS